MRLGVLTFALESSGDPARLAEKAETSWLLFILDA